MFDHIRHASSPIANDAALRCSVVSVVRKDRAASNTGASDTPVFSIENTPGTISPPLAMPRKDSASPEFARSRNGCSRGGSSNGRIAGVGTLSRKPKCADSPAMFWFSRRWPAPPGR
jgi:hypothetical protein